MISSNVFDAYEISFSNGEQTVLIAKDEIQARHIISILFPSASITTVSILHANASPVTA